MVDVWESRAMPRSFDHMRKKCTGKIDLQLSLLVPEPDYVLASWQIESAVDRYIKPFINNLPLKVCCID